MAKNDPKSRFAWSEGDFDKILTGTELLVVLTLALSVTSLAIMTLIWIFVGCSLQIREQRMTDVLQSLGDNWKAVLILLIPLFYRTTRRFISRMTKGPFGVEAPAEEEPTKPNVPSMQPNPSEGEQT